MCVYIHIYIYLFFPELNTVVSCLHNCVSCLPIYLGSHRQSSTAHRQPVLPEPPAAQSSHGRRVRPHQPATAAQLPGGVAAGPHRVGDEERRGRVPAAAA